MGEVTVVVALLILLALCSALVRKLSVPYPTVMVLVGAAIAFVPGLPHVALPPEAVFLVFLPPLLYSDAWYMTWHELRGQLAFITSLAVLLVLATIVAVAVVAHAVIPGMSWGVALVLSAILSPTDAIAASSIAHRMAMPRRLVVLIEGEGLLNDAAAIVAYRVAVAAVVTGMFSTSSAVEAAAASTIGGVAIGLAVGWLSVLAHRLARDATLETVITLMTPFAAYLPAEQFHLSGVLAVVTAGLYVGYRQPKLFTAETRLQSIAVWKVFTFMLNGVLFILIGLQMPLVMRNVAEYGWGLLMLYAMAVCAAVVGTRMLWLYLSALVERAGMGRAPLSWGAATVVGWAGMRGGISLAAVLALPTVLNDGTAFPHRDLLAFLVFAVILFTLVLQSLSLPTLVRASGVRADQHGRQRSQLARETVAQAVVKSLQSLSHLSREAVLSVADQYRVDSERQLFLAEPAGPSSALHRDRDEAMRHALQVERDTLLTLRNSGEINDETLHEVLRDADLREVRLARHAVAVRTTEGT
jgi:monovalent cation/hydrogen antiporter